MNSVYPLTLVCVLKMKTGPSSQSLRSALDRLQEMHPLLKAVIKKRKSKFWFEEAQTIRPIPVTLITRNSKTQWLSVAREELNLVVDHSSSPLMRVTYLEPQREKGESEIILSLHHAIADGMSLLPIVHKLMFMAGENEIAQNNFISSLRPPFLLAPEFKKVLPSDFKDLRLLYHLIPFMYRQFRDQLKYNESNKKVTDSSIPSSSHNDLLTINFSDEESLGLIKWTRYNKLTLNNTITAAMLKTVNRHKYADKKELLNAVQFANLRPYLNLPISETYAGCFAALMRSNIAFTKQSSITQIAAQLDKQFYKSAKRGEKFLFALMGNTIVKRTIRAHNQRLGAVALSYAGPVQLKQHYGNVEMLGIHAFIANNCLGTELSGFGKLCFGRLSLDLNYLTEETTGEQAKAMAKEIKSHLLQLTLRE
jgi:NRPS condensation-like uncharacterized protein